MNTLLPNNWRRVSMLVLQLQLDSEPLQPSFVVASSGDGLMPSSPIRCVIAIRIMTSLVSGCAS